MSCDASFCSERGSKRRFDSYSSSDSKRKIKKCVEPENSTPRTSEEGCGLQNFLSIYIFVRLLGSGAFGVVKLMQHRISGIFYAVKVVKKTNGDDDEKVRSEIKHGMMLNSKYICKVHGYHEDNGHFYIIMECLEGIDLCDFIRNDPKFFVKNPESFWFVVKSILQGLVYLHSQEIAHFDIKPDNVFLLLNNEGIIIGVKLIDLGLAVKINENEIKILGKLRRGTGSYMAPEIFHMCWITGFKADIWSFGMTAYAMLMASLPISSKKKDPRRAKEDIYRKIENLLGYKIIRPFPKRSDCKEICQIEEFITSIFIVNPVERPTAQQLLDNILAIERSNTQIIS